MKRILVVYYTQSGQLFDIVSSITSGLKDKEIQIDYHKIQPKSDYSFPWKKEDFFDVFPESFLQKTTPIFSPDKEILEKDYDLVLLAYQVWYLSPSIPITSFLKSKEAKRILNNTPVITVIGCRNMWIMAQEKVKKMLQEVNANLVGNIALVDKHINHISVITIVHWMFTGQKTSYLKVFPKPGVSSKEINSAARFANPIKKAIKEANFSGLQDDLKSLGAVNINSFLILSDKRANVLFKKWADYINAKGESGSLTRRRSLKFFNYYLIVAIWIFMPIVFIVFLVSYLPLYKKILKEKAYYSSILIKND